MKFLFAQGNPGSQYDTTRHNIGWRVLDALAGSHDATFNDKSKFYASIAEVNLNGDNILLAKPSTFYNETGRSIRALVDFYKIESKDILVIHDDLALPLGTIRVRQKGSDAGNNGIKSINAAIGPDYSRIRIGIATGLRLKTGDANFVLGRFSMDEQVFLNKTILPQVNKYIENFLNDTLSVSSITLNYPQQN